MGLLVLIGWAFHLPLLIRVNPAWPQMAPLTAFCFVLLGFVTASMPSLRSKPDFRSVACVGVGLVIVLVTVRLACYLASWPCGELDRLWVLYKPTSGGAMAAPTAVVFLWLGTALWLALWQSAFKVFQGLALAGALLAWLSFSGYFYGGEHPMFYSQMAFNTSVGFLLLSLGILCLRTDDGLMALLSSNTMGGVMGRRLLVPALLIPLFMGWITQEGQYIGWYDDEAAHSLFALSSVVFFVAAVWLNAALIHRGDLRRQEVERHLRASLKDLKDFQFALDEHAIVAVTDPRGRIKYVNDLFCKMSKYSREELIGQDHRILNSGYHPKEFIRNLWSTIEQGRVWKGEIRNRAKDGSFYWLKTTIVPFLDSEGKPYQYVAIRADITERKEAEFKVQSQLERLNLLHQITRAIGERQDLSSIFQVAIGSIEEQLPVDFCCLGLYDKVANELVISSVGGGSARLAVELSMMEEAHIAIDQNGLSRCVRGQLVYEPDISQSNFAFPLRLSRGGLHSLVVVPLQVESNVFGVVVAARRKVDAFSSGECEFLRQLSEHVALASHQAQLHASLQKAYDDLRLSQQTVMQQERLSALGQMASGIAHDINNALSPATLYLSLLLADEENPPEPHVREYLETVQCAVEDVAATVARMREFYRPMEARQPLVPVDLNRMVKQVIDLTRAKWKDMMIERGLDVSMRTDLAMELPSITAAENEIREALINLVFNAVDAMPEGGSIVIKTLLLDTPPNSDKGWVGRFVAVEVSDTGLGMDEATRQRCLEPFFTTKGERGNGLGLAMVYGVVQRHCADVQIESALGKGTTVRLCFPLPEEGMIDGTPLVERLVAPRGLRILVVDDDPLLLRSMGDILEAEGHVPVLANGGMVGIDLFMKSLEDQKPFSVVFTDLGMPRVDGRKVAAAIKQAEPTMPIIMLTGWGERLVTEGGRPKDVDMVVSKPPKVSELREALARCCQRR